MVNELDGSPDFIGNVYAATSCSFSAMNAIERDQRDFTATWARSTRFFCDFRALIAISLGLEPLWNLIKWKEVLYQGMDRKNQMV